MEQSELCLDFAGKAAVVTGASRGIGRAAALSLAGAGAKVAAVYRTESDQARSLQVELQQRSPESVALTADITRPEDLDRLSATVGERFGGIDVLINSAGAAGRGKVEELADEEWLRLIDNDLNAVFRITRCMLGLMKPGSAIVFISGAVAPLGQPGLSHYGAAKMGTIGFMRALAKEVGPRGIRANVVASGIANTDRLTRQPPEVQERYARMTALGRVAQPQDIANAALFLASDLASFITGAVLTVDGGA